jgi:hypothetical protein
MNGDRQRASVDWRLTLSARAIVAIGVWSLFMVLLGTMTIGVGLVFFVGMGLLFASLITVLLVTQRRDHGSER